LTLSVEDQKWREERLSHGAARKQQRGCARFAPMNAIADGGWLPVLTPRELRVWFALYRLADRACRVRASHGTIARIAGMRREDAARTTARLERRGLIRVRDRGRTVGQDGKRTANVYELLVPCPCSISGSGDTIEEDE
jgi:CRP-like cAMP-binding protein